MVEIADLSHLGLLKISGPDAKKLLQGQLTCDMEEVTSTQSRLGAHCNPKGRVISLSRLFFYRDHYFLQMPKETVPIALSALKKYAVFFKVTLSDASEEIFKIGFNGETQEKFFSHLPKAENEMLETNGSCVIKLRGKNRFEIISDAHVISDLRKKIPAKIISANSWKSFDIAENIPDIYPETSEKFLPHEINLHQLNAISFKKGCYTGQEIIARMQYRGKLKKQLYRAQITSHSILNRGDDIYFENNASCVLVDYCKTDLNTYQVLVILPENAAVLDEE